MNGPLVKIQSLRRQEAKDSLIRGILELVSGKETGMYCERSCHSSCVISDKTDSVVIDELNIWSE